MKIRLFEDKEALSQQAAADIFTELNSGRRINFAPTGGSSPLRLYQHLIARLRSENAGQQVHYYLQDEVPLRGREQEPGVIYQHIDRHLLTPAGIPPQRIHALTLANAAQHDAAIAADGGLALLLLHLLTCVVQAREVPALLRVNCCARNPGAGAALSSAPEAALL